VWPERFGKYFVVRKIASGGMSDVFLCRLRGEEGFEKTAAVKVIHPRLSASVRFRDLFAREARIAASLSHPNLVQVFDFGREEDSFYLAMEYIPGWNLAQVAARIRSQSMSLPLEIWRSWTEGMIEGLGYLHARNIVHRDVSPGNVLLSRSGVVKIADFGIARPGEGGRERSRFGWEGKVPYLSPEQARGEPASFRSDLFSAAVASAELFLPGRLFGGADEETILGRILSHSTETVPCELLPQPIAGLLRKALHPDPEQRYRDAADLSRAIAEAVPAAPARAGIAALFDALFPEDPGDEETVVPDPGPSVGGGGVLRERRGEYGAGGRRRLGAGIAAGIAAVSLGALLLNTPSNERPPEPVAPPENAPSAASAPPPGRTAGGNAADADAARDVEPEDTSAGSPVRKANPVSLPAVPAATRPSPPPVALSGESSGATLLVTEPEGVDVFRDDGAVLGNTPLRIDQSARIEGGLLLRSEGYRDQRIPFTALSGRSEFRVEMEPRTGTLPVLQAIPWARVYEGERLLGVTPIVSLRLQVGVHSFRFVNEALGVDRMETVEIREGENDKVVVPLIRREGKELRE